MPRSKKTARTTERNTREVSVEGSASSSGQNMEEILRMLVDDRRRRDEEFAEERRKREEEVEAERQRREREVEVRMAEMREQMATLLRLVSESGSCREERQNSCKWGVEGSKANRSG